MIQQAEGAVQIRVMAVSLVETASRVSAAI